MPQNFSEDFLENQTDCQFSRLSRKDGSAWSSGGGGETQPAAIFIGRHRRVDNAELRPPPYATTSALFTDIDDDVDHDDIVGVVARFHHGVAAAILDEQIMGVASEKTIDCAATKDLVTLFAGDVGHGDNEIGTFATQRHSRSRLHTAYTSSHLVRTQWSTTS